MPPETKQVTLSWREGMRFEGGERGRPPLVIDADNVAAPGPMTTLLLAAAACSGADVVNILTKMRVRLAELWIEASGVRREEEPRRYVAIHLTFHLRGDGLDQGKAARAVDLSLQKYCSVVHSLAPDIRITSGIEVSDGPAPS